MEQEKNQTSKITDTIIIEKDTRNLGEMMRYFRRWLGKNDEVYPLLNNPGYFRILSSTWISAILSIESVKTSDFGYNSRPIKLTLQTLRKITSAWLKNIAIMHYAYKDDLLKDLGAIFEIDTMIERYKQWKKNGIIIKYSEWDIILSNPDNAENMVYDLFEKWYTRKGASRIYGWILEMYWKAWNDEKISV